MGALNQMKLNAVALALIGTTLTLLGTATGFASTDREAQQAWQRGRSLIEQGLQSSALEPMRAAADLAPEDVDIHRDYMDLMKAEGFHREVVEEYRKRRDQEPTPTSHYLFGRATGDMDVAHAEFQKALAADPEHIWSIQGLGGVAAVKGKYDEALSHYQRAVSLRPDLAEIHNKIANIHLARGDTDTATAAWKEAMRLAPSDYHAYLNLGAVRSMAGDLTGAAELLAQAVQRASGNPLAHVNYAYILFKLQRFEESLAHFAAALAINPRDRTVRGSRDLVAAVAEGRIPFAAFAPYEKALAAQLSDPKKAVQHYREVLLLAPQFATAHMNLGLVLVGMNQREEALSSLRRAVELDPQYGPSHYNLGYLLLGMGKSEEAEGHLLTARRLVPDDTDTLIALGMLAMSRGQNETAHDQFRDALSLEPRNPMLWAQLATAQTALGAFNEAIQALNKALTIAPQFVAGRIQLVAVLRMARRFDEALTELAQLEELSPGHPDLAAERAALESARSVQTREAAQPGRLRVSRILVSERRLADELHSKLSQGASFPQLATAHSEGPERSRGGDIGFVSPEELRPEVRQALKRLSVGQNSPVIDLGGRFLLLQRTR
ncbi:MAG TPA: hypothetical protein DIU15_04475 [Deltaproteobacteria bacterium]|nr:hypothetical protein [Deltaproteobacteria bacterium]HCP45269.1 hypothetical protein [Deltaproteobacteria bacterium]